MRFWNSLPIGVVGATPWPPHLLKPDNLRHGLCDSVCDNSGTDTMTQEVPSKLYVPFPVKCTLNTTATELKQGPLTSYN